MIKKIQQYLLLHYPRVWNTRLIPMLLILAFVHFLVWGLGYIVTDNTFNRTYYYYSSFDQLGLLYPTSFLISILLFIGWFVFYNRNNGLKVFYPQSTKQLYLEWLFTFVIISGITFIPFSLTAGHTSKWKSVATITEAKQALKTIKEARVLIPFDYLDNYQFEENRDTPIPVPNGMKLNLDSIDKNLFALNYVYDSQSRLVEIKVEGYTGPSILYYNEYYGSGYYEDGSINIKERQNLVKTWLQENNKDSIYALMQAFNTLQKKHNFEIDLTPDKWYKRIYNPPFFPINESTIIINYGVRNYNNYRDGYGRYDKIRYNEHDIQILPTTPNLESKELEAGYQHIMRAYTDDEPFYTAIGCLCFAIAISVLLFSYRITTGKHWLIAIITTGIIIFIAVLLGVSLSEMLTYQAEPTVLLIILSAWIFLFVLFLSKVIVKITTKKSKKRSKIYINILLWLLPCLLPLSYAISLLFQEIFDKEFYENKSDSMVNMFLINIIFVIIAMFPISSLIRGWKSIAEE